jgi:hypothetical protein
VGINRLSRSAYIEIAAGNSANMRQHSVARRRVRQNQLIPRFSDADDFATT